MSTSDQAHAVDADRVGHPERGDPAVHLEELDGAGVGDVERRERRDAEQQLEQGDAERDGSGASGRDRPQHRRAQQGHDDEGGQPGEGGRHHSVLLQLWTSRTTTTRTTSPSSIEAA